MKIKNFLVAGIVGGIVDFLLGWVFYGMLFKSFYPDGDSMDMTFVALGCLTIGLFVSYLYNKWIKITKITTGLKTGAVIGLFMGLIEMFFDFAEKDFCYKTFVVGLFITVILTTFVGGAVAYINKKMDS